MITVGGVNASRKLNVVGDGICNIATKVSSEERISMTRKNLNRNVVQSPAELKQKQMSKQTGEFEMKSLKPVAN
jgi:hypothetical protein